VHRLAPSGPSLLVGFGLLALAIGGYLVARETPLFEIRRIDVRGGPPVVRERVRAALEPLEGASLVGLRAGDLNRRIASLPDVVRVTHDRAFPHTLRVHVLPERPLVVLRRGRESWLVSARARVVRPVVKGAHGDLPRVWVPRGVEVAAGDTLGDATALRAVHVLGLAMPRLPARIRTVRIEAAETAIVLRSGVEVRLGRAQDLALKLAVATAILPRLGDAATYVDVAVPARPVADGAPLPQLQVEGTTP
jgi:cell division septal protein FtsQ